MFRKEVVDAQRASWLGEIQLAAPISSWVFATLAVIIIAFLILLSVFGTYTRREQVTGQLVPGAGLLKVESPIGGTLSKVWVHDGQAVKRGDSLVEVSGEQESAGLGSTRAFIIEQLHAQQDRYTAELDSQKELFAQQDKGLSTRIGLLKDQIVQVDEQIALAEHQTEQAQKLLDRIEPLRDKGYISAVQIQQEDSEVTQARSQLKSLSRQRLDLQQQLSEAEMQLKQSPLNFEAKVSEIRRSLGDTEQQLAQNELQRAVVLRAVVDGTVATLPARVGQMVTNGDVLVSILPEDSKLEAELLVPSRAMGFVRSGAQVVLRYDAFPYQKFGRQFGVVSDVSRSALTPQEIQNRGGKEITEPVYRVAVKLDRDSVRAYGKDELLKPGMTFKADILLEHRRLYEWVLEPLHSLAGSDQRDAS